MIGMRTILEVADNSGARRLACILPRGGDLGLRAGLGDVVTASVKEAAPDSAIKKGKVPGLLMGVLQIGWFAVGTFFSADYILRGMGMASKPGTLSFGIVCVLWGGAMARRRFRRT